jgi:hypothetical protein
MSSSVKNKLDLLFLFAGCNLHDSRQPWKLLPSIPRSHKPHTSAGIIEHPPKVIKCVELASGPLDLYAPPLFWKRMYIVELQSIEPFGASIDRAASSVKNQLTMQPKSLDTVCKTGTRRGVHQFKDTIGFARQRAHFGSLGPFQDSLQRVNAVQEPPDIWPTRFGDVLDR